MSFNLLASASSFRSNHALSRVILSTPSISSLTSVVNDATKLRIIFTHDLIGTVGLSYEFIAVPNSGSTITASGVTASPYVISGLTQDKTYTITCIAHKNSSSSSASLSSVLKTYMWETSTTNRDCTSGHCLASPAISVGTNYTLGGVITVHWVQN